MLDTVLFDLDGTLLPIEQNAFVALYFKELSKVLSHFGIARESSVDAVWRATDAMIKNDGAYANREVFWRVFAEILHIDSAKTAEIEGRCDSFYENEFNIIKTLMRPTDAPARAVKALKRLGYRVVLATNPIFPRAAAVARLSWLGLRCEQFELVTDYANSRFCKPNLEYYREILAKIGAKPNQCLMVGNNVTDDMCAGRLGMQTYLVTGYTEGTDGADLTAFRSGSIEDFAVFAANMPKLGQRMTL